MQTPQKRCASGQTPSQLIARLPNHFTASAIVLEFGHILLVNHKRIGAWLPPGGHIEPGEYPHEACVREVFEETGVMVEVVSDRVPDVADSEAFFPPQPMCLHIVKASENGDGCFHLDLVYICRAVGSLKALPVLSTKNTDECLWVKTDLLAELPLAKNVISLVDLALAKYPAGKIT